MNSIEEFKGRKKSDVLKRIETMRSFFEDKKFPG
jgi:hypothetical protein